MDTQGHVFLFYDDRDHRFQFVNFKEPDYTGHIHYFAPNSNGKIVCLEVLKQVTNYNLGLVSGEENVLDNGDIPGTQKAMVYDVDLNRNIMEVADSSGNALMKLVQRLTALHDIVSFRMAEMLMEKGFPEFDTAKDQYWYTRSRDLFKVIELYPTGKFILAQDGETRSIETNEDELRKSYIFAPNKYDIRSKIKEPTVQMVYEMNGDEMAKIWLEQFK